MGIATGYLGGWLDTLFMRVVDVLMAFPFLILVVAIMSILGPGLSNLYIAFGVVGWIPYRASRAAKRLPTRNLEYVHAARTIGCHDAADHAAPHPAERHRARRWCTSSRAWCWRF